MTPSPASPADASLVRSALLAAAEVGPFFRLELHDRGLAPGWQPAHQLFRNGLAELTASTARRLRTGETRPAASILHQAFAARLWSPVLGCALLAGAVPDLTSLVVCTEPSIQLGLADLAGWRAGSLASLPHPADRPDPADSPTGLTDPADSPTGLTDPADSPTGLTDPADSPTGLTDPADSPSGLTDPADWHAGTPSELAELTAGAVAVPLAGLARALPVPLADGLLRGNSASAMTGALAMLATVQPHLGESAAALAAALLRTPGLVGAGRLIGAGVTFRRRSCCLYYRVPGGGLCGDCCFDTPPAV